MTNRKRTTRLRKLGATAAGLALIMAACSSGVSEEDYEAALDAERSANETISSLQADLSQRETELAMARGETAELTEGTEALSSDLEAARTDLADALQTAEDREEELTEANEAIDDLRQLSALSTANGSVLFSVQSAGTVRCGIHGSFLGFSELQPSGRANGFDVDFCRAIAAAALGDADAVEYVPLTAAERFDALHSGSVDVLVRVTTHTLSRSGDLGLDFGPTIFYDGQKFMGRASVFGDDGAVALDGRRLCAPTGTRIEEDAAAFAAALGVGVSFVHVDNPQAAMERLRSGACDAVTSDASVLNVWRRDAIENGSSGADELVIFPETPISKEPLAPAILQGDTFWSDVVDWTVYATLVAEEHGVTSRNIDSSTWSPDIRRLFGVDSESALRMGLPADAFYQVIKQVGNYGEIYDRNLSAAGLERQSLNLLWFDGGLLYAPRV